MKKADLAQVVVTKSYFKFDELGREVLDDKLNQIVEDVTMRFSRRSSKEVTEQTTDALFNQENEPAVSKLARVILSVDGFEDFSIPLDATPLERYKLFMEYFSDENMSSIVDDFYLGWQRRTLPANLFQDYSNNRVEISGIRENGSEAGTKLPLSDV